ncbi:9435_t:CDS:2 [Entrophospora sp. SA101]|nr:9435_t:CDS:2 [Entrophospora sp. SA101]
MNLVETTEQNAIGRWCSSTTFYENIESKINFFKFSIILNV